MNRTPYIKSQRQKRALEVLFNKVVSVRDLGSLIGALNPGQIIFELRQQGFRGIIETRSFLVIDRDGKECHPGEYYVPDELKSIVEKALKEYAPQARTRRFRTIGTPNNTDCSKGGGAYARPQS